MDYMALALAEAHQAAAEGEIPVGAVLVKDGQVIARAHNRREAAHDPTAHAEMLCMREAARHLGDWRLRGCTLYVTLEPCPMCAGAIINARIGCVVFGAREPKSGSVGSVIDLFAENYGFAPAVYAGVRAAESAALLREFFEQKR